MVDYTRSPSHKWAAASPFPQTTRCSTLSLHDEATDGVAAVYNQAGDDYAVYADGDPTQLFAFDGMHAYADRQVWGVLESKLVDLRASGQARSAC